MLADDGVAYDDDLPFAPPPGEEAFYLSHEGGEHEAFAGLTQEIRAIGGRCVYVSIAGIYIDSTQC
jgi:hypothetical protein